MVVVGVIPARYGSTRLPAKPLLKIKGRPLLQWVIEGAKGASTLNDLRVATDHPQIADLAESLGVKAIMTAPELPSGSDRVWAAVRGLPCDIVLNIQGDEPLLKPSWIDATVKALVADKQASVSTLAHDFPPEELHRDGSVKVIVDRDWNAIYFSRYGIPYSRKTWEEAPGLCYKHIGIYGYRKTFLAQFCHQSPTEFERAESLEQLRALWMGAKIKVAKIDDFSVGVDTPDDVKSVEKLLAKQS